MNRTHHEPERDIPVVEETDVFVAGAGPAGVCAALAAARQGARVRLVDSNGCLGGVWTAGLLCWIIDAANKPGLVAEIGAELDARGARRYRQHGGANYAYDPEVMKLLLEELCLAAGVDIQFHTRVVAAARDASNRLAVAITESKSGRQAWAAKVFIDASGDGDLGFLAGCGYAVGHPETGQVQPMSLTCVLTGMRFTDVARFVGGSLYQEKLNFLAEIRRGGFEPSYQPPVMIAIHDDLFSLIANHEYGVPCNDAEAITNATIRARREVNGIVSALRGLGGIWKDIRIVATGEHIGVREGRRIKGRARIELDDMLAGRIPEDSIATCTFGIDVHSTDGTRNKGFDPVTRTKTRPYGLPLRALIAADCDGLLLAGRCISGDFLAHSSYRVTGDAAAMGEAAGVCAALAAGNGIQPHEVPWPTVRDALERLRAPSCHAQAH